MILLIKWFNNKTLLMEEILKNTLLMDMWILLKKWFNNKRRKTQ